MVTHTFNTSSQEAKAGRSLRLRPAWSTGARLSTGQSGLYQETLPWKKKASKTKLNSRYNSVTWRTETLAHAIEAMSPENMVMKATKAHCLHYHETSTVRRCTPWLGTEAGGENRTDCLTFMNDYSEVEKMFWSPIDVPGLKNQGMF